ncbi:MAG TPA: hypothetical protein VMH81_10640 [Bryobacteraceae bacterium]|nr:hypothetical protein [Bryobacteraceae bacterium]
MPWFPIGPNAVFSPRDSNFKRLSRRNEWGRQGLVANIAVDPTNSKTIYIAELPTSGGQCAFRTEDNGASWVSITDALHQTDPNVQPHAFAVNPAHPATIYMGDGGDLGVYVSGARGDSWNSPASGPSGVFKLIVDPRTASTLSTTVILAAASNGVWRSADGGSSWTNLLAGQVTSLVADMPTTGTDHYYAGVASVGVFTTTNPTGTWTNLNNAGIGLPKFTGANFQFVLVDYCVRNPNRVYAWFANPSQTVGLHTTSSPTTSWTQIAAVSPPDPSYGFYSYLMAVAPNSPGDGATDILFFGRIELYRSIDAGVNWQKDGNGFHADQHAFTFVPANPPAGTIPTMYIGCDGGISMSDGFCDPTFAFATAATDFDELDSYTDTPIYQTLDHGKQSSAVYQYASDPTLSGLSYMGCQDTGINAGDGALGWRGFYDGDGGAVAMAQGPNGVIVWGSLGEYGPPPAYPSFLVLLFNDQAGYNPGASYCTFGSSGPLFTGSSNFVAGLDGKCLTGVVVLDSSRTLTTAITSAGTHAVTPSSMAGIVVGKTLAIDTGNLFETVLVTAVTATTFTATFSNKHAAGVTILLVRAFVGRVDQSGIGSQISQEMDLNQAQVNIVAAHPTNANILFCGTNDQRVFSTNVGASANASTVWTEAKGSKPAGIAIASIAINHAGSVYVLLQSAVTVGPPGAQVTTPLFQISVNTWVAVPCTGLPGNTFNYGKLCADPVQGNVLYASNGARVYQLTSNGATFAWQDISDGLPGQWVYDLWIGNIGTVATPKVLLRAAIPTRAIWERDVTAGAVSPAVFLYLRANVLDQRWLPVCPENIPDPYNPTDPGSILFHYQCVDIKVDAQQPGSGTPYFQNEPESPLPISGVIFDQMNDTSPNLPTSDAARVHVQLHNRSNTAANNVSVWAVFANAAAGLPGLNVSPSHGNAFNFWSQFSAGGTITPALPSDSPWRSIGAPKVLSGISAATPQVASWDWTIPLLAPSDPGHYCIVALVHSAASPIGATIMDVDSLTPGNRQVGQKNVHVGPPLPASPSPGGGGGAPHPLPEGSLLHVEFNNPTAAVRTANLVIDARGLPPQLSLVFQTSALTTVKPLSASITGVASQAAGTIEQNPQTPPLAPVVYTAGPSARVEIEEVQIPAYGKVGAVMSVTSTGPLPPGSEYRFQVQQIVGSDFGPQAVTVGGSVYVVRIAGTPPSFPGQFADSVNIQELFEEQGDTAEQFAERVKYVPPFAKQIAANRSKLLNKKP